MQYKKGQVKILSNTHTGRETYVDLQDVVLFPATESEIKLGDYLDTLNKAYYPEVQTNASYIDNSFSVVLTSNYYNIINK